MTSIKKRRTVRIQKECMDELKSIQERGGFKPTTMASLIFESLKPSIGLIEYNNSDGRISISMKEYLFFAIKRKSNQKGITIRRAAHNILTGANIPLTAEEIAHGIEMAQSLELQRLKRNSYQRELDQGAKPAPPKKIIDIESSELEKIPNPDDDHYGGSYCL